MRLLPLGNSLDCAARLVGKAALKNTSKPSRENSYRYPLRFKIENIRTGELYAIY
jgi:hypothetical protein